MSVPLICAAKHPLAPLTKSAALVTTPVAPWTMYSGVHIMHLSHATLPSAEVDILIPGDYLKMICPNVSLHTSHEDNSGDVSLTGPS
jgi:hypothetical protein